MKLFPKSVLHAHAKNTLTSSVYLFIELKVGVFYNTDENVTHTLPCFFIRKIDRKKKTHHPLIKPTGKNLLIFTIQ